MACPKIALTMLILGSVMILGTDARAQADAPGPARLAQVPTPQTPPATPPLPPAASQPAAPTSPQPADPVGSVATLQGSASVTRNNATSALALRDPVYKNDVLQTKVDGTLGITFDDETTFTLKPNTQLAVDEFVYQEGGANNAAVFNVVRGTAAFVAAEVAHTGNMRIDTPSSTLGIRGTTGLVEVPEGGAAGGQVSIKLYPDADGRVGRIEVFRPRRRTARNLVARRHRIRDPAWNGRPLHRGAVADFGAGSRARSDVRAPGVCGADRGSPDQSAAPHLAATAAQSDTAQSTQSATARPIAGTRTAARAADRARRAAIAVTRYAADATAATRRTADAAIAARSTANSATATRRNAARRPTEPADIAATARSAAGSTARACRAAQTRKEKRRTLAR